MLRAAVAAQRSPFVAFLSHVVGPCVLHEATGGHPEMQQAKLFNSLKPVTTDLPSSPTGEPVHPAHYFLLAGMEKGMRDPRVMLEEKSALLS